LIDSSTGSIRGKRRPRPFLQRERRKHFSHSGGILVLRLLFHGASSTRNHGLRLLDRRKRKRKGRSLACYKGEGMAAMTQACARVACTEKREREGYRLHLVHHISYCKKRGGGKREKLPPSKGRASLRSPTNEKITIHKRTFTQTRFGERKRKGGGKGRYRSFLPNEDEGGGSGLRLRGDGQ